MCRTNDGTQRFILVPIAESGAPSGQYQYAPNQTYPRNQNKANATSYVIPFPLSQVNVLYITNLAQVNFGSIGQAHESLARCHQSWVLNTCLPSWWVPKASCVRTPKAASCLLSLCHRNTAHPPMCRHTPSGLHDLCQQALMCW